MLRACLPALLVVAGCAPLQAPPAVPPPSLTGTIGGRPFRPRSALMIEVNHPTLAISTAGSGEVASRGSSQIQIYESSVTCADVVNEIGPTLPPGERTVGFRIHGRWPVAVGSEWPSWTSESIDADEAINATFDVGGLDGGAGARGTTRVVASSGLGGTFDVALESKDGDTRTRGSVYGRISFIVCGASKF